MIINANGVNYNVNVIGSGEPLVLLHGFTGNQTNWNDVVLAIKRDHKCVLIDIIGHGRSDSPSNFGRYEIEDVAKDITFILDELGIKRTNILGYSMGGRLALAYSILFQERVGKLILESSSPGLATEEEKEARIISDHNLAQKIEENGIEDFVHHWENISLFSSQKKLPDEKQKSIREQRLQNNPIGLANSLRGMGTGSQPSYWERLRELTIPTLLLCGEFDTKFCFIAESMSQSIENCTVRKIKNAGHAIHVEQPEIFGKIVNEFVGDQKKYDQFTY